MKYPAVLSAVLLAAACGSSSAKKPSAKPAAEPAAPATPSYVFDWSPPCRVPVTEITTKNHASVTIHYDVVVTPNDDRTFSVTREHFEFVKVANKPVDASQRAQFAPSERMLELLPAVIIDGNGDILGSGDIEPYIEALIASSGDTSPEVIARARAFFSSAPMREGLAMAQENLWSSWVGNWVGAMISPGEHIEVPATEVFGPGVEGTFTLDHLGTLDGLAHLRVTMDLSGEVLRSMMADMFQDIATSTGIDPAAFEPTEASGRWEYEVVTDPATLRPLRAVYGGTLNVPVRGADVAEQQKRHETMFDWAHATGCK